MTDSLFRPEVFAQRQHKWLGEVILIRPISFTALTVIAVLIASVVLAYMVRGQYTKKATVTGELVPEHGLIKIQSSQPGVVLERRVQEGQSVYRGDVLFVLSAERKSSAQGETQAEISKQVRARRDSLREQLHNETGLLHEEETALTRRFQYLREELVRLKREIATQRRRVALAEDIEKRFAGLQSTKFVSALQVQEKAAEVLDQEVRLQAFEREKLAAERELDATQNEIKSLPVKGRSKLAAIERDIAATEQELTENEARRQFLVTAPEDGTATAFLVEPGQTVSPSTLLVSIVPAGDKLRAHLYAPSRAVGFIEPGGHVRLRYHAYPYQKFGQHDGVVTAVSRTALQPDDLQLSEQIAEPLYRLTVDLSSQTIMAYGRAHALHPGMRVDADVLIDRRRLIEWALEPLFSITGRW